MLCSIASYKIFYGTTWRVEILSLLFVPPAKGGGMEIFMFLGLAWYWWLVIMAVLIISIPFKVKFMKWWSKRQREKKGPRGKWGDDE